MPSASLLDLALLSCSHTERAEGQFLHFSWDLFCLDLQSSLWSIAQGERLCPNLALIFFFCLASRPLHIQRAAFRFKLGASHWSFFPGLLSLSPCICKSALLLLCTNICNTGPLKSGGLKPVTHLASVALDRSKKANSFLLSLGVSPISRRLIYQTEFGGTGLQRLGRGQGARDWMLLEHICDCVSPLCIRDANASQLEKKPGDP